MKHILAYGLALLAILAAATFTWFSKPSKALRVRHAVAGLRGAKRVEISWKGKTVIAHGDVSDDVAFAQLSDELAQVAGANYVVNETRVASHEQPSNPDETAGILSIPVNSRYDDSPESLRQIAAILRLPQVEVINVAANQTLSSIIVNRYRFGESDFPQSYALLAQRIVELNGLHNTDQVHPGQLKVPILPPRAEQLANVRPHAGLRRYVSKALSFIVNPDIVERAVAAPRTRPSEAVSVISIPVTNSELPATRSALANLTWETLSSKMTVEFASYTPPAGASIHATLTQRDSAFLHSVLARKPSRNATVFILDDGWPDPVSYSQSIDELQRLSDIARDHYDQPHVNLRTSPFVALPSPRPHSSYIRDALKEFTDADVSRIVKVVYIPLSQEQNSTGVMRELLWLHYIGVTARNSFITDKILAAADKFVSDTLKDIQSTYDDRKIYTDDALLEAVWSVANLAAKVSSGRDVFFINESWTVKQETMQGPHTGVSAGLVVAATGNAQGKEVNSDIGGVDFARQCTSTKSVVAAMNVLPGRGIVCHSSIVKADLIADTFVAGFDGEVYPGPDEAKCLSNIDNCVCGTSFSAPRIAWLLALYEALRTTPEDYSEWNVRLEKKLLGLRPSDKIESDVAITWRGLYLSPTDLLKP